MKWVIAQLKSLIWLLVIVGVFLLIFGQWVGFVLLAIVVIYFTLDTTSRIFFPPSKREDDIHHGLCPDCGHDLTKIGAGQTTCPNCGEAVPATLRKWRS